MNFYQILGFVLILTSLMFASENEGFEKRKPTENIWMPTAYTLHQGEFAIGIGPIGVGLSDNLQIESNILLFLLQTANVNLKLNLFNSEKKSIAFGLAYNRLLLSAVNDNENSLQFSNISPYFGLSLKAGDKSTFHITTKYSYSPAQKDIDDYKANFAVSGTEIMVGFDYDISYKTKLLAEYGYDFTFKGKRYGGGVLFGWENFRLKLGVSYFGPANSPNGYTWPIIGLLWRFKG